MWIVPSVAGLALHACDVLFLQRVLDLFSTGFSVTLTTAAAYGFYKLGFFR